jgi:hypothetical protein
VRLRGVFREALLVCFFLGRAHFFCFLLVGSQSFTILPTELQRSAKVRPFVAARTQ